MSQRQISQPASYYTIFSLHRITSSYAKFPEEGSSGKRFSPTPHNDHIKFITDYNHWDCFLSPLLFSQFIINVLQSCKFARNESLDKTERTKSSVKLSAERTCSEETQLQFLAKFHTAPSLKICDVLSFAGLNWCISDLFNFICANQISTCSHKLKFIMQVDRWTGQEPLIAWTEKGEQERGWREAGPSASTLQNCLAHHSREIPLGSEKASSPSQGEAGWGFLGGGGGAEVRRLWANSWGLRWGSNYGTTDKDCTRMGVPWPWHTSTWRRAGSCSRRVRK